jgi:hypothetical protein
MRQVVLSWALLRSSSRQDGKCAESLDVPRAMIRRERAAFPGSWDFCIMTVRLFRLHTASWQMRGEAVFFLSFSWLLVLRRGERLGLVRKDSGVHVHVHVHE